MPRKKSIPKICDGFIKNTREIDKFIVDMKDIGITKKQETWIHEYAIIRLYAVFEEFILQLLIGLINRDSSILSQRTGYKFPSHLNVDVCQYLIIKDGFFDFKGRDGLIREIKSYIPYNATPYSDLINIIKDEIYKDKINIMFSARNLAAHHSKKAMISFKRTLNANRHVSAGVWLKSRFEHENNITRMQDICRSLIDMSERIKNWYEGNF